MIHISKQKSCQKFIYKLPGKRLKQAHWNLALPLSQARKNKSDIVALNDSQLLRWICELNQIPDWEEQAGKIRADIKKLKKSAGRREHKHQISTLYEELYSLQYIKDYVNIVMDNHRDYDQANQGFLINGSSYHRLLGTNGGIKKSTITYVSDHVYAEVKRRMENGRDLSKALIPAKLEAYQALICSASIPVTQPRIVIVNDCFVTFTEDVLHISQDQEEEPALTYRKDYEITYCDSDGYGFMSPRYSRIVNRDLHGEAFAGQTLSGINTRYAWTKGMLFTFDFVQFARQMNAEHYLVVDAWGTTRDVREFDVILTTSMVKLWDSYESLEHFIRCSEEHHYQFAVAKETPHKLEHVRNANYQFLQTYDLTDEELAALCQPTIDEITDVLGGDWRKTLVFLKGMFLNDSNIETMEHDFIKALMIEEQLMNDPFIRKKVYSMIKKRIQMAAKGSLKLSGNFAMISGDLYSLAQSIFGLPVTGLLKAGEVYHKYWCDKGVDEIICFRAPMTCHNNIRRQKVVRNEQMDYWYQYVTTGLILNSWDSTCDALNGADKDSDAVFTTDNPILLRNTRNVPVIECVQKKAAQIIPAEPDLIAANKLAFGDEIGATTNRITAMIEVQSGFAKGSPEYEVLDYRIKCGQHYQQTAIDKAKGIISRPMPKYWYDPFACMKLPEATAQEQALKALYLRIVADKKPYFLRYVYPELMTEYNQYLKATNSKCIREFRISAADLLRKSDKTPAEQEFVTSYEKRMPVGNHPCLMNRICWFMEDTFGDFLNKRQTDTTFDPAILKSGVTYSNGDYQKIQQIKLEYDDAVRQFQHLAGRQRLDKEEISVNRQMMLLHFQSACAKVCPKARELCDMIIDLCYTGLKSKQFAWDVCGETIIENLLAKKQGVIHYPVLADGPGEFEFAGEAFIMKTKHDSGNDSDGKEGTELLFY